MVSWYVTPQKMTFFNGKWRNTMVPAKVFLAKKYFSTIDTFRNISARNYLLCGKTAMSRISVYWRKSEHEHSELLVLTRRFQLNCPSFEMTSSRQRVTTLPRSTMTSSSPRRIMTSSWHKKSHFLMYTTACYGHGLEDTAHKKTQFLSWSDQGWGQLGKARNRL